MDEVEIATQLVDTIRAQNWKNGGVLIIDRNDAIEVVAQALRTAHSAGAVEGSRSTGNGMLATFDAEQEKYLADLAERSSRPVDLTQVVGGPQPKPLI